MHLQHKPVGNGTKCLNTWGFNVVIKNAVGWVGV